MMTTSHAERVSAAFVKLTNTLVADYGVLDIHQTLVEEAVGLVDAAAASLLLVDPYGELQVVASTSEASQLVGTLQLEAGAGPCIECFRTGKVVAVENIDSLAGRWPVFRTAAAGQGFHSVHAIPLRVRDQTVGAMGLFGRTARVLNEGESVIGQALADVATVGLLQARTLRESAEINSQLQRALHSRVVIEQAKGVISQTAGLNMNEAFVRLRGYSRSNRLSLQETASRVVYRTLTL